ncbi:MAG: RNA 2',3'-cyclic phosphodiesterase [Myxococcales bacterium]|jgi:2'-5' RNA ligase
MVRLFIAVTLDEAALEACARETQRLEAALGKLAKGVRFPRPEGLHFTIKFLGWTAEELMPAIHEGLARAAAPLRPFSLRLEGLEAFPSVRRPRVVYLNVVEGAEEMTRLAERVEAELAPLGFPTEKRGFTPHVTLARVKDPKTAARVGESVAAAPPLRVATMQVAKVSLMRSELSPGGSKYTELAGFALGGSAR